MKTSLTVFRVIGFSEGISFLLLLGIAMPLKYLANYPAPVKFVGMLHGLLFILYLISIIFITIKHRWSFLRAFGAFVSSFVPFGPFILEARLRRNS